jgi:hypothetical protein
MDVKLIDKLIQRAERDFDGHLTIFCASLQTGASDSLRQPSAPTLTAFRSARRSKTPLTPH